MPKLRIYSNKRIAILYPARINLFIDGMNIGVITSENKVETDVSFGNHTIQLKSKFYSSELKEFKMDVKKEIEISIKYFLFLKTIQVIIFLSISLSIFLDSKLLLYLSEIAVLGYLILLILKRKDIILIKEVN